MNATRDFFDQRGFILHRSAHPDAGRLRGHQHAVPRRLLRRAGLPDAVRASSTPKPRPWRWARCIRFGPTFRAEKSKTRRHLTEFWMVEPEVAYATLDDAMELAENLITSSSARVLERRRRGAGNHRARRLQAGDDHRRRSRASATTTRSRC